MSVNRKRNKHKYINNFRHLASVFKTEPKPTPVKPARPLVFNVSQAKKEQLDNVTNNMEGIRRLQDLLKWGKDGAPSKFPTKHGFRSNYISDRSVIKNPEIGNWFSPIGTKLLQKNDSDAGYSFSQFRRTEKDFNKGSPDYYKVRDLDKYPKLDETETQKTTVRKKEELTGEDLVKHILENGKYSLTKLIKTTEAIK